MFVIGLKEPHESKTTFFFTVPISLKDKFDKSCNKASNGGQATAAQAYTGYNLEPIPRICVAYLLHRKSFYFMAKMPEH